MCKGSNTRSTEAVLRQLRDPLVSCRKHKAAPVCLQIPGSPCSSTRPGSHSRFSAAKQEGNTRVSSPHSCNKPAAETPAACVPKPLEHQHTHTQTAAACSLGRDTWHPHCGAAGNDKRQKQRSPCAPLRNSVSVNAWCKVQAWLIPGVHERPPTPRGQTHLLCSLQRQRALVCEEAEAGPWDVHSARILPTPASQRSAQALVPRRVGVPECP